VEQFHVPRRFMLTDAQDLAPISPFASMRPGLRGKGGHTRVASKTVVDNTSASRERIPEEDTVAVETQVATRGTDSVSDDSSGPALCLDEPQSFCDPLRLALQPVQYSGQTCSVEGRTSFANRSCFTVLPPVSMQHAPVAGTHGMAQRVEGSYSTFLVLYGPIRLG
jgi:hypothetical protein